MPPEMRAEINSPPETVYQAPDVFNPFIHPPPGEVDVLNIVESGPEYRAIMAPSYLHFYDSTVSGMEKLTQEVGKGYFLATDGGFCDGSLNSWCKRTASETCLLSGHNDCRCGLLMGGMSGWLLLNIPKVKYGLIMVKLESWHFPDENPKIRGWKSINNADAGRRSLETFSVATNSTANAQRRSLKSKVPDYCDSFRWEYSIDGGEVTSLNADQFQKDRHVLQRVVEVTPVLNDPDYTGGKEKDVQLAFRMLGNCKYFKISHVYWA
jgi:hypothetical protein